jgi:hypothetical protein
LACRSFDEGAGNRIEWRKVREKEVELRRKEALEGEGNRRIETENLVEGM